MDPTDAPELTHAPFSPSVLKMFALCPSWKSGDSEEAGEAAANRGTAMHKAFETGDLSICIDEEEKLLVQKALNYVKSIRERRQAHWTREWHRLLRDPATYRTQGTQSRDP